VEIYRSTRKHGTADDDVLHAVEHALAAGNSTMARCSTRA
jgi:predicted GNAT family acetyltransferase